MYKKSKIINRFSSVWDKFMPEMHLRKPGFTHSACGLFTNEETIQKFKETENSIYIYISNRAIKSLLSTYYGSWSF